MHALQFIAAILAMDSLAAEAHTVPYINAEMKVQMVTSACSAFESFYGVLPPQTNWFAELTAATNALLNQKKIVFLNAKDIKDPWGQDLVCRIPGTHNATGADVYSLGRDGQSSSGGNDPDDINNWNSARPWTQYYSGLHPEVQQVTLAVGGIVLLLVLYRMFRSRMKTELRRHR